jgi:hypothetical protein
MTERRTQPATSGHTANGLIGTRVGDVVITPRIRYAHVTARRLPSNVQRMSYIVEMYDVVSTVDHWTDFIHESPPIVQHISLRDTDDVDESGCSKTPQSSFLVVRRVDR